MSGDGTRPGRQGVDPRLVEAARAAREAAHAPYSNFRVGAAVMDDQGRVFSGCNVENATYGATSCAERNAVAAAVLGGARRLTACVVYTAAATPTPPCGICRQVLREFGADALVTAVTECGDAKTWRLDDLLPDAFGPDSMD
jgi:cytidine deaminase